VGGTLYFSAAAPSLGYEPWKSDGTEAGTLPVADINPVGSSGPDLFLPFGSTLFFAANDGVHGREPWRMDLPS
jgi:ELWxxDGT repeat protein